MSSPRSPHPTRKPAAEAWTWRHTLITLGGFLALWLGLLGLSKTGDAARAAAEVAASRSSNAVMVCTDGHIDYPDESLFDRLTGRFFADGSFRCTEWRTREAMLVEQP